MCKLNIFCPLSDGDCQCRTKAGVLSIKTRQYNGVLMAILQYIKRQPDIMNSLISQSQSPTSELMTPRPSPVAQIDSQSTIPLNDIHHQFRLNVLNDLPKKFTLGKPFSVMAQVDNLNTERLETKEALVFQVVVLGKDDGEEKMVIAETQTTGVALFKKIVINKRVDNCMLLIRIKDRNDIAAFIQNLAFKVC